METFSSHQVCGIAGCTYRELDYWVRIGCVRPDRGARGSGTQRRWTGRQAACVWVVARLREVGCPTSTLCGVFDDLDRGDGLWAGPIVVPAGRRGVARLVTRVEDVMGAGWIVDPRPALAAVAGYAEGRAAA